MATHLITGLKDFRMKKLQRNCRTWELITDLLAGGCLDRAHRDQTTIQCLLFRFLLIDSLAIVDDLLSIQLPSILSLEMRLSIIMCSFPECVEREV